VSPDTPIAILAGATGAVGSRLLQRLLSRTDGTRVLALGRRAPATQHPRLEYLPAELSAFRLALAGRRCTQAFCCLGSTLNAAGSRAAFRAVDLHGVAGFAAAAHDAGADFFGLVSSAGADPRARTFYLRTKGESEAAVEALGFSTLVIMQPGLLRGAREEFRAAERAGQAAAPLLDRLLVGRLARYRSVATETLAAALDVAPRRLGAGTHRLDPAAIAALADGG
jgi:uncharacterized protein YbjT (DUF2867 family)